MSLTDATVRLAYENENLRNPLLEILERNVYNRLERRILANEGPVIGSPEAWKRAPRITRLARFVSDNPRPKIHGVVFPTKMFEYLWWEDKKGNRLETPPEAHEGYAQPAGAHTMHTKFPNMLREDILLLNKDGSSTNLGYGESSWSDDVVTAMIRSNEWTAEDALMVYAQACSRCMNVLANHYLGDGEGFKFGSDEYWNTNTCCEMCLPVAGDPHPTPVKREDV